MLDVVDLYTWPGRSVDAESDSDLYRTIVGTRHIQWREWPREEIPIAELSSAQVEVAVAVDRRIRSGWFEENSRTFARRQYTWRPDSPPYSLHLETTDNFDKPKGCLWTSSLLSDGTTAWERGWHEVWWDDDADLYQIDYRVTDDKVFTIDCPGDYVRLCTTYPRTLDDGTNSVDWHAAAADFDVVHLTARGLLNAQANTVSTPLGPVMLCGWDSESSVLLRPLRPEESLRPSTLPTIR